LAGWKDVAVPRPYPREFRDDVVRVARNREDGVTIEQIASPPTGFPWR
jgi:transposase